MRNRAVQFNAHLNRCIWRHTLKKTHDKAGTERIEAILTRLDPVERAIMATPACTIAGLAVKARHAAYVMSHCWDEPIDQIDWEA